MITFVTMLLANAEIENVGKSLFYAAELIEAT